MLFCFLTGDPINILKTYFDFTYFLCISPYRFIKQKDSTNILVHTWYPQMVACGAIHLLTLLNIFIYRWSILIPDVIKKPPPAQYFYTLSHICSHILNIVACTIIWKHKMKFSNILNFLYKMESSALISSSEREFTTLAWGNRRQGSIFCVISEVITKQMKNGLMIRVICIGYISAAFFYVYNQVLSPLDFFNHPLPWNNLKCIQRVQNIFFWNTNDNESDSQSVDLLKSSNGLDSFLATMLLFSSIARATTRYFCDLLLLCGVLTLWYAIFRIVSPLKPPNLIISNTEVDTIDETSFKIFKKYKITTASIEANNTIQWGFVFSKYKQIKQLAYLINLAFGPIVILSIARAILYNSANLDDALYGQSTARKVLLVILTLNDCVMFLLAADSNSQMDTFRHWISNGNNRKYVPSDEINIVLQEIGSRSIGIRGGNMFTITYSLLYNALTTVVTYFIICVQTRMGNHNFIA